MVGIAREMSGEWYGRGHRARHEDRCSPCPCLEQPGPRSRDNMFMPDNRSMPGSAPTPDQYLPAGPGGAEPRDVREIADGYVLALADLDPTLATALGLRPGEDRLPDLSPAGQEALDDLARGTLAELTRVEA